MQIEAATMKEAFQKAANELNCSLTDIHVKEVIQHPSSGFLGFFKKNAIIEVVSEKEITQKHQRNRNEKREQIGVIEEKCENFEKKECKKQNSNESKSDSQKDSEKSKSENRKKRKKNHGDKNKNETKCETTKDGHAQKLQKSITDPFADSTHTELEIKPEYVIKLTGEAIKESTKKTESKNILDTSIIENFNQEFDDSDSITESKEQGEVKEKASKLNIDFDVVIPEIKDGLTRLFGASCFVISKIEVSKFSDDCVLIELDGKDAALLIGKEGYRYKAISYLLHNWLSLKYDLAIRLEIAEFLKNQESMMDQYLNGVIERVQNNGKAQTKPLDGILVKIALAKLREKFPDKYVGIKSNGNEKFVVVNEFFKK